MFNRIIHIVFLYQSRLFYNIIKINFLIQVAKKCEEEKDRRYNYSKQLAALVEIQRKYVAAVKQLTIECRKNEALLAQLRAT